MLQCVNTGPVAQRLEQGTHNPLVPGSNPGGPSLRFGAQRESGGARWACFFMLIFAIALPALLEPIKSRAAVWVAFALSIFPVLRDWDERLWPNEMEYARRVEQLDEWVQLRDLAISLESSFFQRKILRALSGWQISREKVDVVCENALTSRESVTI